MMPRPRLQEELAYHPPVLKKVVSPAEKVLQAVLVAVVGTGLGIGVGVFLAGRTLPSGAATATSPEAGSTPATGTTNATGTGMTQTKKAIEGKSQADPVVSAANSAPAGLETSATKQIAGAKTDAPIQRSAASQIHQVGLVRASLTGIRIGSRRRRGLRHRAALAAVAHTEPFAPALVEEAKLEIPDGRFLFTIEGDQTAVAYDSQSGIVSTDGSGMFVVEKAPGEAPMVRAQETPSNVHYKCDQDANCSLIMASLIVPHAHLRSAGHTTDWAYVPVSADGQAHDRTQAPVYFGHVSR